MARKPCRNGSNCKNRHCLFQHEPSQSQCDVQVGSPFLSANQHIWWPSYFSASFPAHLEAALDNIVPISTRTDQPKQECYMTDFKEVHQDLPEKMTRVLHILRTDQHKQAMAQTVLVRGSNRLVRMPTLHHLGENTRRTDQHRQTMAQIDFFVTDFKEIHQDPPEKMTGVLQIPHILHILRTNQHKQAMDRIVLVSWGEASQDLQEKMTEVLPQIDCREESRETFRLHTMRPAALICMAQKAMLQGIISFCF